MTKIECPIVINGHYDRMCEIPSGTRTQYLKRTKQMRVYADRRNGKDGWSIYNDVKAWAGEDFDRHMFCSPYGGYALVYFRL